MKYDTKWGVNLGNETTKGGNPNMIPKRVGN